MSTRNEVAMKRQPNQTKIRPGERIENSKNFVTQKSTYSGKIETLRRKTVRSEKYGNSK